MKAKQVILIAFMLIVKTLYAQSEYAGLKIGDKVPALTIQQWIKGEPVSEFIKGKVYVVEFSATWCPPCRKGIPHLTELSKKYVNKITILSVYLEDNNTEDLTDLSYVRKVSYLMEALGNKMDFTTAVDVPQQVTKYTWRVKEIPKAFVVDRSGNLAWIGNPMDLDPVLKEITEGNFDSGEATQRQKNFKECLDNILEEKKNGDYKTALHGIDSLIKIYPYNTWLCFEKFGILAGDDDRKAYDWLQWLLDSRIENFDWPHFVSRQFYKISPTNRNYSIELRALDRAIEESETKYLRAYPLSLKAATYATIGDYKKAVEMCQQAIENSKDGGDLNRTARYESDMTIYKYRVMVNEDMKKAGTWLRTMVDNRKGKEIDSRLINTVIEIPQPDYNLALELIDKALEEGSNNKVYFLERKSQISAITGNFLKAIELCQQVIKVYNEKGMPGKVREYENLLAEYRQSSEASKKGGYIKND